MWWISNAPTLGEKSKGLIANPANTIYVSAATPWEIGIKRQLGKLVAPNNIESIISESGFEELAISCFHTENAALLPLHHKDPFDRVIIAQAQAQAQAEGLEVLTSDSNFGLYGIRVIDARK